MYTKKNIILAAIGGILVGYAIHSYTSDFGRPKIKVNPITANEKNGLPVLSFLINGKPVEAIDGDGKGFGSIGDVTWSYTRDGKKYMIVAYDTKTLKSSSAVAVRPDNIGIVKTK